MKAKADKLCGALGVGVLVLAAATPRSGHAGTAAPGTAAIRTVSEVEASGRAAQQRYSDPAMAELGFLDVTKAPYSADPGGKRDSTAAIQRAINDARDARLVAYVPPGRYLVSGTIEGIIGVVRWDHWPYRGWADPWEAEASFEYPCVLMGAAGEQRSVLVLADQAPGFGDAANPKPVLYFWARSMQVPGRAVEPPDVPQPGINFNQKILHLDIELGKGNPGAVGIDHRGAEGSTVEDVGVRAEGAFAGFRHAPGSGGAMHGIRANGGRFGLYLDLTQRSPLISDVVLKGQTEAAIHCQTRGPLTIVGADVEGAGIDCERGPMYSDGALNVVDSVIRVRNGRPAISTPRSVVVDNVWIENAKIAVDGAGYPPLAGRPSGWTHVARYAAGSLVTRSKEFSETQWRDTVWLNRKQLSTPVKEVQAPASGPPAGLLEKHRLPAMPGVDELRAASVRRPEWGARGDGKSDDTAALQKAIDSRDLVFLPKGRYAISKPLRLRGRTKLMGASNIISVIEPVEAGHAFADVNEPSPLIDTVDDAAAGTMVAMLRVHLPVTDPSVYAWRWRAGRDSVVRNVYPSRSLWHPNAPAMNFAMARIEGNGGGRWYTQTFLGGWSQGPDFRFLLVNGTRQPLRFYHLQAQFGRGNAMIEMRNAANVDIYSMKSEGDFTLLWLRDSHAVRVWGHNGLNMAAPGWAIFRLERCRDVTLTNLQPTVGQVGHYIGHLVNYDPRRWFILSDGGFQAGGLEQIAYYQLSPE